MLGHLLRTPPAPASARAGRPTPVGRRPRRALLALLSAVAVLAAPLLAPAALADPGADGDVPAHAYRAEGAEVSGGSSVAEAPEIGPGLHRDVLEHGTGDGHPDPAVKYYRISVADGQRVHAAATLAAPPYPDGLPDQWESLDVEISFVTAQGEDCVDRSSRTAGETSSGDGPVTTARVSAEVGPDGCAGDAVFLRVTRTGEREVDAPLPVEIQVAIQPAGLGGGAPSVEEEIEDDGASPVAPASGEPIAPGRSFASALPVEPGSVVLELVPGETALVAIDVREGQRLRWRTEVTRVPGSGSADIGLRVFDAVRGPVTVDGGMWTAFDGSAIHGGGMVAPVDLGNRSSETESIRSAWLPGTYYVQLQRRQVDADAEPEESEPLRLILTLEVDGEVAEDAVEGDVLELGDAAPRGARGEGWSAGRIALLGGAGLFGLLGVAAGIGGLLVLRGGRR